MNKGLYPFRRRIKSPKSVNIKFVCWLVQVMVRDLYKERDLGRFTGSLTEMVDAHGVLALKLTPVKCA